MPNKDERGEGKAFERALYCVGGKWKARILRALGAGGTLRYKELRCALGQISDAVLSASLRELTANEMIERTQHTGVPPRVEYTLTEKGASVLPLLDAIEEWASRWEWKGKEPVHGSSTCDYHSPV